MSDNDPKVFQKDPGYASKKTKLFHIQSNSKIEKVKYRTVTEYSVLPYYLINTEIYKK